MSLSHLTGKSVALLVCSDASLYPAASCGWTQWGNKNYMSMKNLEAVVEVISLPTDLIRPESENNLRIALDGTLAKICMWNIESSF